MQEFKNIQCGHCHSHEVFLLGNNIPDNVERKYNNAQLFLGCFKCHGITSVSIYNASVNVLEFDIRILLAPMLKDFISFNPETKEFVVKQSLFS